MNGKTALDRGVNALRDAVGGRPFVLVIETTHRDANRSAVRYETGDNMRTHEILGLLRQATLKNERYLGACERGEEECGS